jgi:hypothetical protein
MLSFSISLPLFLLGLFQPNSVYDNRKMSCEIKSAAYKLLGSLFAFYIPLIIILFTYTLTMRFLTNLARSKVNNSQVAVKYTNTNVSDFKEFNSNSNNNLDVMKQNRINLTKNTCKDLIKSSSIKSNHLVVKNSDFSPKLIIINKLCSNSILLTNQAFLSFMRHDLDLKRNNLNNNYNNKISSCFQLENNDDYRKLALDINKSRYNLKNKKFKIESIFSDRSRGDIIMYFTLIKRAVKISNEFKETTSNKLTNYKNDRMRNSKKSSSIRSEIAHTSYSHNILNNTDLLIDDCSNRFINSLKTKSNRTYSRNVLSYSRTRSSNNGNNEKKALKVLIIIFLVFICLWAPFFILNVFSIFYCKNQIKCELDMKQFIIIATWLGYISSMANPIIYTMFSKNFRKAFIDLFKFKKLKSHKRFLRQI